MKATVKRLVQKNEELRGTENYSAMHMEFEWKNNTWKFISHSVPNENVTYDVTGTKNGIFLTAIEDGSPARYKLDARHMPFIDFIAD